MKYVVYNRAMHGRNAGDHAVINDEHALTHEAAGDVRIIDHPVFRHPSAREFAGLPPPIAPPPFDRAKKHR